MQSVKMFNWAQEEINKLEDSRPVSERIGSQAAERRLAQMQRKREKDQRKRMHEVFKERKPSPATPDADFCAPNDVIET